VPHTETAVAVAGGKPLSRAELVAKAGEICRRLESAREARSIRKTSEFKTKGAEIARLDHQATAELAALVPPAVVAGSWRHIVADSNTVANDWTKVVEGVDNGQLREAAKYLTAASPVQSRLFKEFREAAVSDCEDHG
jgi:hypothetical protein